MEGDLSREDEARLIEELDNARDEIKNIKMRQASLALPPFMRSLSPRTHGRGHGEDTST